jgi:hypothetical protein
MRRKRTEPLSFIVRKAFPYGVIFNSGRVIKAVFWSLSVAMLGFALVFKLLFDFMNYQWEYWGC